MFLSLLPVWLLTYPRPSSDLGHSQGLSLSLSLPQLEESISKLLELITLFNLVSYLQDIIPNPKC